MGYYTIHTSENLTEEQLDVFAEMSGYSKYYLTGSDECKWYSFEDDFRALSLKFPGELLVYGGEGEESGDLWKAYAKDGKYLSNKAILTYPDFFESELK